MCRLLYVGILYEELMSGPTGNKWWLVVPRETVGVKANKSKINKIKLLERYSSYLIVDWIEFLICVIGNVYTIWRKPESISDPSAERLGIQSILIEMHLMYPTTHIYGPGSISIFIFTTFLIVIRKLLRSLILSDPTVLESLKLSSLKITQNVFITSLFLSRELSNWISISSRH